MQKTYYWGLIDHITTMSLIIPLRYLTNHNIIMDRMIYNKYLSRSIIYTHSYKILQLHKESPVFGCKIGDKRGGKNNIHS